MSYPPETIAGLLKLHEDWLRIVAIPGKHGGFDIAVVIDGTYNLDSADPVQVEKGWRDRIAAAMETDGLPLGVPLSRCPGRAKLLGGEEIPELDEPERRALP